MKTNDNVLRYSDFLNSAIESGKLIYSVLESFPLGIVITNADDEIIYVNFKIAQITGYSRKEMMHQVAHKFLHFPNQRQRLNDILDQRHSNVYETYELYVKRNNGTPFLAHTVTAPYKNEEDKTIGTISIITDITLTKRHAELEAIAIAATKASNSVMITDKLGRIEWVNQGFTNLSGYKLFEVIDTKGEILMGGDDTSYELDIHAVASEKKPILREYKKFDKNGTPYWVVSSFTPVLDHHGDIKEITIIDTDITRQKSAEIKLLEVEKRLEELLKKKDK